MVNKGALTALAHEGYVGPVSGKNRNREVSNEAPIAVLSTGDPCASPKILSSSGGDPRRPLLSRRHGPGMDAARLASACHGAACGTGPNGRTAKSCDGCARRIPSCDIGAIEPCAWARRGRASVAHGGQG